MKLDTGLPRQKRSDCVKHEQKQNYQTVTSIVWKKYSANKEKEIIDHNSDEEKWQIWT